MLQVTLIKYFTAIGPPNDEMSILHTTLTHNLYT